jgi:predicted site-specific integrase-resolvase
MVRVDSSCGRRDEGAKNAGTSFDQIEQSCPPGNRRSEFEAMAGRALVNEGTMSAHRGKFVAYFRVSTDKQGKSGLGLEAQRKAVHDYLNGGTWSLIGEFTEIESCKRNERPELVKALTACKRNKAKLVIAKLDRLSRNLAFIATLMDSGVEFVAVDNPHATKLTIHILAAVAQREREMIAQRTIDRFRRLKLAVLSSAIRSSLTFAITPLPA